MRVAVTSIGTGYQDELEVPDTLLRQLRRSDAFIRLGVLTAYNCLDSYPGKDVKESGLGSCGIMLATAYGTMQTNFGVLDSVIDAVQTSPTLFSHSVFNSAAGYLSSTFSIDGPAITITDFSFPFFRALREAIIGLGSGSFKKCLVLQVETYSELLQDGRMEHGMQSKHDNALSSTALPWNPGAVCWLVEAINDCTNFSPKYCCLRDVVITDEVAHPQNQLDFREEILVGGVRYEISEPLGSAMRVSRLVNDNDLNQQDIVIQGEWGEMKLLVD